MMAKNSRLTQCNVLSKQYGKWWLAAILLLAFSLRIIALDQAPPGLRYDELQNYLMAGRVLEGERPLYFAESWGHEPLYHYLQAGALALVGASDWSLRLPSVVLGMIELAATWLVAKQLAGRRVGLLSLIFLSLSFWAIFYSRVSLRVGAVTAFASLMIFFLWRLWQRPASQTRSGLVDGALAGLFMAAAIYTYLSGRVLPAIFLGFVLFTAVFHWPQFKKRWLRFAMVALIAILLCWPLYQAIAANPTGEQRLELLNQAIVALQDGDPGPILNLTGRALGMYVILGEQDWLYNLDGRPIFNPLTVLFFLMGLALIIWRWRQPRFSLLLLWFLGGTGPAMIAPPAASVTHTIVAQPAAYILLGIGLTEAWNWLARQQKIAAAILMALLITLSGLEASRAYFSIWNQHSEVQQLYQGGITAVADAVQAEQSPNPVLLGGPYINYWQPWNAVNYELAQKDDVSQTRWFNPAGGWVWPAAPSEANYYFPTAPLDSQQYDPYLLALFEADASQVVPSSDAYKAYTLQEPSEFEQRLAQITAETTIQWPPDFAHYSPPTLPLQFGGHLALLAISQPEIFAANAVRFITFWEVQTVDPAPLVAFVHLTSDGIDIWGQQDWLDVRQAGLQPGDRFAQIHTVPINPGTPTGLYYLQLGLYNPETVTRLPITAEDGQQADRIFAATIRLPMTEQD